jgi:hypothetical protein
VNKLIQYFGRQKKNSVPALPCSTPGDPYIFKPSGKGRKKLLQQNPGK